ncbi:hypothetical protein H3V53_17195 [Paraburkholderia bengalensis]|uniref:Secreted protein n=1 Tax=Paraburkholderia bengalensis TaxID=2747562 RepID=A0ABU8ITW1_9BURK
MPMRMRASLTASIMAHWSMQQKIGSFVIALTDAFSGNFARALVSAFVSVKFSAFVRLNSHRAHRAFLCATVAFVLSSMEKGLP